MKRTRAEGLGRGGRRRRGWRIFQIPHRHRFTKLTTTSVKPIPEGYTSLTPFLCIDGAAEAIAFYISVFGATLVDRMDGPNGTVAHAELDFGHGRLQPSDPNEAYHLEAPAAGPSVTHSVALYCADTDAVVARAEEVGATIREPAPTFLTGDRFASILDPFGQRWTVMTRVEDVSPEERDRRMADWARENV